MSVLIKGMDMPNDRPIIISIFPNGRVDTMEAKYFDSVLFAVEVPTPHGDLVDRDVVAEKIRQRLGIRNLDYLLETEKPIAMSIKEAPIVIESEE